MSLSPSTRPSRHRWKLAAHDVPGAFGIPQDCSLWTIELGNGDPGRVPLSGQVGLSWWSNGCPTPSGPSPRPNRPSIPKSRWPVRLGTALGPDRSETGLLISLLSNLLMGVHASIIWLLFFACLNGAAQSTGWSGLVKMMAVWFQGGNRGIVMA